MKKKASRQKRASECIFLSIPEDTIFRIIDGETVIVKPEDSSMLFLNETGTFIFEKLLGHRLAFDELIKEVVESFEISETTARQDIRKFINVLKKENIITVSNK